MSKGTTPPSTRSKETTPSFTGPTVTVVVDLFCTRERQLQREKNVPRKVRAITSSMIPYEFFRMMRRKVTQVDKEVSGCVAPLRGGDVNIGNGQAVLGEHSEEVYTARRLYEAAYGNHYMTNGTKDSSEIPSDCLVSFHTHPTAVYQTLNIKYAWPSSKDIAGVFQEAQQNVVFHMLFAKEGVYYITPNTTFIREFKSPLMKRHLKFISALYVYIHGLLQDMRATWTPHDYVVFANSMNLYNLQVLVDKKRSALGDKVYRTFNSILGQLSRKFGEGVNTTNFLHVSFILYKDMHKHVVKRDGVKYVLQMDTQTSPLIRNVHEPVCRST